MTGYGWFDVERSASALTLPVLPVLASISVRA